MFVFSLSVYSTKESITLTVITKSPHLRTVCSEKSWWSKTEHEFDQIQLEICAENFILEYR